jgi:hypothetical protein
MLGRKIAASGARLRSSAYIEVNAAAHCWRAVVLPGMVEVPELAERCGVVTDPRPRALGSEAKEERVGRAELAGGSSSKFLAEPPVRKKLAFGTRAAPSRELPCRCKLGARSRAVGGRSHL